MNSKQKKIMLWTGFIIMLIIGTVGVALWIYGFVSKDELAHYVGIATAWVSPSLLIGLAAKWLLGKHQAKNMKNMLTEAGLVKPAEVKVKAQKVTVSGTPWKVIHNFELYYDEEQRILLIKIPELTNKYEYLQEFKYVLGELMEEFRKMG